MDKKKSFTCREIADTLNAEVKGNKDMSISKLNRIDFASSGELTFFADEKFKVDFEKSQATCIIVSKDIETKPKENQAFIFVDSPYLSFVKVIKHFDSLKKKLSSYIDQTALIANTAEIDPTSYIGKNCIVGDNCKIGKNTVLKSCVTLYDNVTIGDNTLCHANVVLCDDVIIGNNCILHPGAVIGSDGFGFTENKDGSYDRIPQIGTVEIQNNVEIGANTTIDRAIVGATIIENGTKIDNLVQVAHNVIIGENTGIAAQSGISGSTKIGKRNRLAGQTGLSGHIHTVDDVTVLAQSGLSKSITKSGSYFGSPVKEARRAMMIEAVIRNLPELQKEVYKIKKEIDSKK